MNKLLRSANRIFRRTIVKHAPEILFGMGVTSMGISTILAVEATPKALKVIESLKGDAENVEKEPTKTDIVKHCWKLYIPSIGANIAGLAFLIMSKNAVTKKQALLATIYTMTESAFNEYKNKVIDTIGVEKEREIVKQINQDIIERKNIPAKEVIVVNSSSGSVLFYEPLRDKVFEATINDLDAAKNEVNNVLNNESYASLNTFYYSLGLSLIDIGRVLGWSRRDGLMDYYLTDGHTEDQRPCFVINYTPAPTYDYDKYLF